MQQPPPQTSTVQSDQEIDNEAGNRDNKMSTESRVQVQELTVCLSNLKIEDQEGGAVGRGPETDTLDQDIPETKVPQRLDQDLPGRRTVRSITNYFKSPRYVTTHLICEYCCPLRNFSTRVGLFRK